MTTRSRAATIAAVLVAAVVLLAAAPAAADAVPWSHLGDPRSARLASGLSTWVAESNLKQVGGLGGESWWAYDLSWNRYSYVRNNPLKYTDPTGKIVDTIFDVGFIAYDLYVIGKENVGGGTTQGLGMNLAALGGDVVGAMVPFLTGGGTAVRGGMKLAGGVDDVVDGARAVENVTDAARGIDGLADGARRLPFSDSERLTEVNRTLDRVDAGGPFPHKQDGSVFMNREGRLPEGNYREYTVDTPGANNRGTRRVVVDGDSGRTYYSDDHYQNFVEIDPTRH